MRSNLTYTLDEIAEIYDGPHATPKKLEAGNAVFLSISSIENGRLNLEKSSFISEDDFIKWTRRVTPRAGDVVFSYETKIGEASIIPEGLRCCLGRRMGLLRAKQDKVLPQYLLYAYLSPAFQDVIREKTIHGSTTDRISIKEMPSFVIQLPDILTQKKTIEVLNSIDSKLSKNSEINQTLEQMTQALFKSWFVDFEPVKTKIAVLEADGSQEDATLAAMTVISGKDVDALAAFACEHPEQYAELKATAELFPSALQDSGLGEIPERWNVLLLEDVTSLIIDHRGKTPKKLGGDWSEDGHPAISAKNIKNGRLVRHDAIKYVDSDLYAKWMKDELLAGDILMTSEAPLGELLYLAKDCDYLLSQRLYGIRANNEMISGSYLYFWLQTSAAKADINGRATGSTVVGIRQSELKRVNVMVPQKAVVESFSNLTALYLEKIESNEKQNIVLKKLRDTLLPKLLSGEITLPEAEEIAKEADYV